MLLAFTLACAGSLLACKEPVPKDPLVEDTDGPTSDDSPEPTDSQPPEDTEPPEDTDVQPTDEECHNGVDDDQDGLTDCEDADCLYSCWEHDCQDTVDNDDNGLTDCEDDACAATAACAGSWTLALEDGKVRGRHRLWKTGTYWGGGRRTHHTFVAADLEGRLRYESVDGAVLAACDAWPGDIRRVRARSSWSLQTSSGDWGTCAPPTLALPDLHPTLTGHGSPDGFSLTLNSGWTTSSWAWQTSNFLTSLHLEVGRTDFTADELELCPPLGQGTCTSTPQGSTRWTDIDVVLDIDGDGVEEGLTCTSTGDDWLDAETLQDVGRGPCHALYTRIEVLGDIDGDGIEELRSDDVLSGSFMLTGVRPEPVGDLDGDGDTEVVLQKSGAYYLLDDDPDALVLLDEEVGKAVNGVPLDVDGDGVSELLRGASEYIVQDPTPLLDGLAPVDLWSIPRELKVDERAGRCDVDGDGADEVWMLTTASDGAIARVDLYRGDGSWYGHIEGDNISAVTCAGDVVGGPGEEMTIYRRLDAQTTLLSPRPGPQPAEQGEVLKTVYGTAVPKGGRDVQGDLTGDGRPDLVVVEAGEAPFGMAGEGRTLVFPGN